MMNKITMLLMQNSLGAGERIESERVDARYKGEFLETEKEK